MLKPLSPEKIARVKELIRNLVTKSEEAQRIREEHDKKYPPIYDDVYFEGVEWLDLYG